MTHPMIETLIDTKGYSLINASTIDSFLASEGVGLLFVAGDFEKNLETPDVAIILPELVKAYAGAFHVGVVDAGFEDAVREKFDVWPTPSLIFVQNGARIGVISKVRDWSDYLSEINEILGVHTTTMAQ